MEWRVVDCTLNNGREVELVDVPGHRDFLKTTVLVRSHRSRRLIN
jgi:translation elongation factor EF-1alpha